MPPRPPYIDTHYPPSLALPSRRFMKSVSTLDLARDLREYEVSFLVVQVSPDTLTWSWKLEPTPGRS